MATINFKAGTDSGKAPSSLYYKTPRLVYRHIDLVKAVTSKGSALAAADVIQAIALPQGTWVIRAGAKVIEAAKDANGAAVGTLNFGVGTLGDAQRFVTQSVGSAASTGYATDGYAGTYTFNPTSTDSINILVSTYTGTTLATGVITVWALVADLNEFPGANIDATTNQAGVPQA